MPVATANGRINTVAIAPAIKASNRARRDQSSAGINAIRITGLTVKVITRKAIDQRRWLPRRTIHPANPTSEYTSTHDR